MAKRLNFYDLTAKKKFTSNEYKKSSKLVNGKRIYFAKTISPSGTMTSRILSKSDYKSKQDG